MDIPKEIVEKFDTGKKTYKHARYKGTDLSTLTNIKLLVEVLYDRQEGLCFYCGEPIDNAHFKSSDNGYSVDHFFPKKSGASLKNNAVLTHPKCNAEKGCGIPSFYDTIVFNAMYAGKTLMEAVKTAKVSPADMRFVYYTFAIANSLGYSAKIITRRLKISRDYYYRIIKTPGVIEGVYILLGENSFEVVYRHERPQNVERFSWDRYNQLLNCGYTLD